MRTPTKVHLFKYSSDFSPNQVINRFRQGIFNELILTLDITEGHPIDVRRAAYSQVLGFQSMLPDITKVSSEVYTNTHEDKTVGRILYTFSAFQSTLPARATIINYNTGYAEIMIIVDRNYYVNNRINLVAVVDEGDHVMTSTAEITTISQTAMDSSAYKVVRVLVQSDLNSDGNYYIKPFSRLFADVDLGVLEITTKMARNSIYPINSVESRKIAKRNTLDGNFSDLKFKDAPVALTKEVLTYDNIWNNY